MCGRADLHASIQYVNRPIVGQIVADPMAVLSRFSDRLRELSRNNPSRWGDLDRVADVLDEEIRSEFEDDE